MVQRHETLAIHASSQVNILAEVRDAEVVLDLGPQGLDEALRTQVEYYFSVANLCKDVYLRGCMDGQGFVPLDHVCTFKRLRDLCDDPLVVRRAVESSDRLNLVRFTDESSGANVWKVRTVDQPERWVLAASQP